MPEFNQVFIDSVAFIYLIENHPKYYDKVVEFIKQEILNENQLITSTITVAEFCVKPFRENDTTILGDFHNALRELNIVVSDINLKIAERSARLRAQYKFLKTTDALQIASSMEYNCRRFLTNDFELKQVKEIEIILIDNL